MKIEEYGINPIDPAFPAGEDIRYSPEMELLEAELEKLNNPSATTPVDWNRVIDIARLILSQKSKDMLVASYLSVALLQQTGVTGLDQGLELLRSLTEHFWDSMFPEIKRIRGRKQAIQWWADKCTAWLQNHALEKQEIDLVEKLTGNLDALDRFLAESMDEPPSLLDLKNRIGMIPLKSEAETQNESVADKGVASSPAELQEEPEVPAVHAEQQFPSNQQPPSRKELDVTTDAVDVVDASSVRKALQCAADTLRKAAEYLRTADLFDVEAIRLVREAASILIAGIPPEEHGITSIPAPSENCQDSVRLLYENSKWPELFDTAEYYIPIYPYYFDLCAYSALALDKLGRNDLSSLAERLTSQYMQRVRGIETLSFLDGTPFASSQTRFWLQSILSPAGEHPLSDTSRTDIDGEPGVDSVPCIVEADRQKAREIRNAASLTEALLFLEAKLACSSSGYETVLRRASLASFLAAANQNRLALAHAERLLEALDTFHTDTWDPKTATSVLGEAFRIYKNMPENAFREKAETILRRIAVLSPSRAMAFDS